MKLSDARKAYEDLSGKASDVMRQLCLAGIALIWVFKGTSSVTLDPRLLRAAFFVFVALFVDLMQYLVGAITWFVYFRRKESLGIAAETEFEAPSQLNWPTWTFFHLKTFSVFFAYLVYIIPFLFAKFIQ